MTNNSLINRVALAVIAMYLLTTVHHVYGGLVDDVAVRFMVPLMMAIPLLVVLGALVIYHRTRRTLALEVFVVVAGLGFVILLGTVHGAYAHTYKVILALLDAPPEFYYRLNPDEHYPPDDVFFELTGIAEMVAAFFVARYTWMLVRAHRVANPSSHREKLPA